VLINVLIQGPGEKVTVLKRYRNWNGFSETDTIVASAYQSNHYNDA